MGDKSFLSWPFFDDPHRDLADRLDAWATKELAFLESAHGNVEKTCAKILTKLAGTDFLRYAVPAAYGGAMDTLDVRALCLIRETLARHSGLADFVFAMQGLGSGPISLFGDESLKERYLPAVCKGEKVAAFALTEPESGSDAAHLVTTATRHGDHFEINGVKTFISNGGIADFYVTFVRTEPISGARGISALVVDADTPGLDATQRIETIAPHPLAVVKFDDCKVPLTHLLGEAGQGFKIAMATLDVFRSTVGAAALGLARRAFDEAAVRASTRAIFGGVLADQQLIQGMIADMALAIDASALLVYRSAWTKDSGRPRVTREAAMAKYFATESAQDVIDKAVQIFGGLGVVTGVKVEELYREIRALRIYEGASEVQKVIIASQVLAPYKQT